MYLCLKILVEPIHLCLNDCQTEIFMSIRHFTVTSAKQCDTITTCFKADIFSPDSPSYVKFFFSI